MGRKIDHRVEGTGRRLIVSQKQSQAKMEAGSYRHGFGTPASLVILEP